MLGESKTFVKAYGIFTIIMLLFQSVTDVNVGIYEFNQNPDATKAESIFNYGANLIRFLGSLFTFTVPNPALNGFLMITNIIIIIFRTLFLIELLPVLIEVVKALGSILPFT